MPIKIKGTTVIDDDRVLITESGGTDQRPVSPVAGMVRYNTDLRQTEGYNGVLWVALGDAAPERVAYAWGSNSAFDFSTFTIINAGLVGDNTGVNRSSPVTVVGGIVDWKQISTSWFHTVAVTDSGIAYVWGNGYGGKLGNNSVASQSSPVTVAGGITNWSQVTCGNFHSAAITANGIAYAWGSGNRLGQNSTISRSSPVTVVGGITNWSQIAAGALHTAAITDTGVLYVWGSGSNGQLGTNDTVSRSSPVTVVGGITNWSQISSGADHNTAITDSGVLYVWGYNYAGKLGTGDRINRSSPVTVVGGITNWSQISPASNHTMGLTDTSILYAWGSNFSGGLGTGNRINRSSPVTVIGGITNWSQVSAKGGSHTMALTDTGVLYTWGSNSDGRLGTGNRTNRSSPVTVIGGITSWTQISGGNYHSTAIATTT